MRQASILLSMAVILLVTIASSTCQDEEIAPGYGDCYDPCATVRCGYGARCEVQNGRARCVCPEICTLEYNPICGNDGRTYSNQCAMNVYNCKNQANVERAHYGSCQGREMSIADN
uniref:Agrin n=1 Tax=Aceria tosichella TaxID=561515 RepID=A0A6G1SN10_9ACAR